MKDAKGHGSDPRGGQYDSPAYKAGLKMGPNPRIGSLLNGVRAQPFVLAGNKFVPAGAAHQDGVDRTGKFYTKPAMEPGVFHVYRSVNDQHVGSIRSLTEGRFESVADGSGTKIKHRNYAAALGRLT